MKHIIILIAAVFLHANVYSNGTPVHNTNNNEKLIEKLVNNEDVGKLQKLTFSIGILKLKAGDIIKKGGEISDELNGTYVKLTKKSAKLYTKIVNDNAELKKLSSKGRLKVLEETFRRDQKSIKEILQCIFNLTEIKDCLEDASLLARITFATCTLISGIADIEAALTSAGAALVSMPTLIFEELTVCQAISGAVGVVDCFLTVACDIIKCVTDGNNCWGN